MKAFVFGRSLQLFEEEERISKLSEPEKQAIRDEFHNNPGGESGDFSNFTRNALTFTRDEIHKVIMGRAKRRQAQLGVKSKTK